MALAGNLVEIIQVGRGRRKAQSIKKALKHSPILAPILLLGAKFAGILIKLELNIPH
jgi:hypothetical protein